MELNVLATHERALTFRAMRNRVLASNIANADTPGYKARDIEFGAALKNAQAGPRRMATTSDLHLKGSARASDSPAGNRLKYRVPAQPTLDGNTVDTDVEQAAFAENALMYRASLAFLDGRIRTIRYALKGAD